MRKHIARLATEASHISQIAPSRDASTLRRRWTEDELRDVALDSSIAEVLRRLGYTPSGGMHRWIKAKLRALDIGTGHVTGRSWRAGLTNPPGGVRARSLGETLVVGSVYSGRLRQRLIAAGPKPSNCEMCGLSSWRGAALPLALDHINGGPTDNRLENLRILCPNCHAQTETWCGRNRKRT